MSRDVWGTYVSPDDYINAAKSGISRKAVDARIARGWKVEKAITASAIKKNDSEDYKKNEQIAQENGIKKGAYRARVRRGWTYFDAATLPLVNKSESVKRLNEKTRKIPKYILRLAESNGIQYQTLYKRVKKGWDFNKAATDKTNLKV